MFFKYFKNKIKQIRPTPDAQTGIIAKCIYKNIYIYISNIFMIFINYLEINFISISAKLKIVNKLIFFFQNYGL